MITKGMGCEACGRITQQELVGLATFRCGFCGHTQVQMDVDTEVTVSFYDILPKGDDYERFLDLLSKAAVGSPHVLVNMDYFPERIEQDDVLILRVIGEIDPIALEDVATGEQS